MRTTRIQWLTALALACVMSLLATQAAGAYVLGGRPWPHGVITYYNAFPNDAGVVQAATAAWNHSGANVRFVRTSRAKAEVVVLPLPRSAAAGGEAGTGSLGWEPTTWTTITNGHVSVTYKTHVEYVHLLAVDPARGWSSAMMTVAATHEFGHILGLNHSHVCATMDATLGGICRAPHSWQFACRALQPDDVRGAIALYGGRARPLGPPRYCSFAAAPGPPKNLQGSYSLNGPYTSYAGFARLTFRMPSGSAYLGSSTIAGYKVFASQNTCSTSPKARIDEANAAPGKAITEFAALPSSGAWCVSIEIVNDWGVTGAASHVTVASAPSAQFSESQEETNGLGFDFTDGSTAEAGTLTSYAWNFGDPASGASNTSTQANPSHQFSAQGSYRVTETVTNSYGERSTDVETVVVQDYTNPVASFGTNCTTPGSCPLSGSPAYSVYFTDQSFDDDGSIVSWSWNFGDPGSGANNTSSTPNPTHDYAAAGHYTVTLTITDEHGKQASSSQTVYIDP